MEMIEVRIWVQDATSLDFDWNIIENSNINCAQNSWSFSERNEKGI